MYGKKFGGIGRYVQQIVSNLVVTQQWDFYLIVTKHFEHSNLKDKGNIHYIICNAGMFSLAEQICLPLKIPRCDVFWSPYMNVPFLPCLAKKRIVTLHDVFHLANPQYFSFFKILAIKSYYFFSVKKSNLILTVSEFSKQEIQKYLGYKCSLKTKMIYNGCDLRSDMVKAKDRGYQYILFVGNIKPHKNLVNALLGYQLMKNKKIKFVIVGKKEGFITNNYEIFSLVERINKSEELVTFTGNIDDEDLYSWYKGASLLIQPSFYEGFGLPIVEAMAFGLPIVCSDIPVFREIGKNFVSYFLPNSPQSIAQCMDKAASLPHRSYPLWMSWKKTAELVAQEINHITSQKV